MVKGLDHEDLDLINGLIYEWTLNMKHYWKLVGIGMYVFIGGKKSLEI